MTKEKLRSYEKGEKLFKRVPTGLLTGVLVVKFLDWATTMVDLANVYP